ncbi:hypothetical protein OJF2_44420 [Aquisphaera giovannonii]|uniref:GxxExxY protein n=1 Tax=Aquisphaera giovannonii TaxID=406548 RepID=A0A5B9W718_9BACT|nr:GxxExxY protein [Aquisphaera giovannonii]QEH35885.1 hypothetical protein OJF2_44420 [Aquisphaera giovannonii]
MGSLHHEEQTYAIRGAVIAVHQEMGAGFLEAVYQECLARELTMRGIPFEAKAKLRLRYKGQLLDQVYEPDFLVFNEVIVEIKAAKEIAPEHKAQILNYLKASGLRVGLLVNFGAHPKAHIERLVFGTD